MAYKPDFISSFPQLNTYLYLDVVVALTVHSLLYVLVLKYQSLSHLHHVWKTYQ